MPPAQARIVPVALIGLGGVGKAILSQLTSPPLVHKFRIVAVANSKKYLFDKQGVQLEEGGDFVSKLNKDGVELDIPGLIGKLSTLADGPAILIDSTATDTLPALYPTILSMNIHLVTPNKKGFSSSLDLYEKIARTAYPNTGSLVYAESTVGAGLPILSTLKDLVETGDEIQKIEGVFSGTLSYIFNEFSKVSAGDVPFSQVVKVAKDLGYTEPDPRDDLSGSDVARKLTILSRLLPPSLLPPTSLPQGYTSLATQSLVPDVLARCATKEEYLERLEEGDEEMNRLREEARREGKVVRFVGVVDVAEKKIEARLGKYPFDHPFATALQGSDNIISFTTKRYSPRPLIIQGSGAGADVTAMGVTSDMIKIYERIRAKTWGSGGF